MIKQDLEDLGKYARDIADHLGLRDWTIVISEEPADEGAAAQVEVVYGRKWATILVCEEFRDKSLELQRWSIIHELIHCHRNHVAQWAIDEYRQVVPESQGDQFERTYRMLEEFVVDGLAEAISPRFPLIEWNTPAPDGAKNTE